MGRNSVADDKPFLTLAKVSYSRVTLVYHTKLHNDTGRDTSESAASLLFLSVGYFSILRISKNERGKTK